MPDFSKEKTLMLHVPDHEIIEANRATYFQRGLFPQPQVICSPETGSLDVRVFC